jgi:hypothetical protein
LNEFVTLQECPLNKTSLTVVGHSADS